MNTTTSTLITASTLCAVLVLHSATAQESPWHLSLGARVWYADWTLDESVTTSRIAPPPQPGGQSPNNGPEPERDFSVDADPELFTSLYLDAIKGPWSATLAYGFSSDYEFRNARSRDSLEREDMQVMVQYAFENRLSLGLGLHRIDNEGTTDGGRDNRGRKDFEYSFTGPEGTVGYSHPLVMREDLYFAATASGTMGWYLVDDTAGFLTDIEDTPGFAVDVGVAAAWKQWRAKIGYRWLYIDDSIWSIDRIEPVGDGELEREVVDASETFKGVYVEVSYLF